MKIWLKVIFLDDEGQSSREEVVEVNSVADITQQIASTFLMCGRDFGDFFYLEVDRVD